VVTNYHVIEKNKLAEVTLADGSVHKADVVGLAPDKDLAVLLIHQPPTLKPIPVGTSDNLLVGQKVFAIGTPFGFDQTLTTGIISGLGREITSATAARRPIQDVIQTDAAINRGNSGGPLLDSAGRVIGINTAIFSPSGTSAGIGFAVPVDTITRIVPQLISHGRAIRPGLGVLLVRDEMAKRLGARGVIIQEVLSGSAAEKAGLRGQVARDGRWVPTDIIVGIDDVTIETSSDLFRALDSRTAGETVSVQVERDGETLALPVVLAPLPN